jgi:hypothetical protein
MVVPYGFAIGDFIAGIDLIFKIGKALKDSVGSRKEFKDLLDKFRAFEYPLIFVKRYTLQHRREIEANEALMQMVMMFQEKIDEFLAQLDKYQAHLGPGFKTSFKDKSRANVAKIQFRLFKHEDIQRWTQDLVTYALSLNILIEMIATYVCTFAYIPIVY